MEMDNKVSELFSTGAGQRIYETALQTVVKHRMDNLIKEGVLVGFSGGADSVMLLCFLTEYRHKNGYFDILACHINHMIRGENADRDERFAVEFCDRLNVPIVVIKKDVPRIASDERLGIEEAARNARYSSFADIIKGRDDISSISTAHNLSDNTETVLFNLVRGAGLSGMGGISAVRGNVFRPLIEVSGGDIREALDSAGIKYVIDETNEQSDYTRNYLRHEVTPRLLQINPSYERAVNRMVNSVREADEYIKSQARDFLDTHKKDGCVERDDLVTLSPAVLSRVLFELVCGNDYGYLGEYHIFKIRELLPKDNFSVSLPDGKVFVCERGSCSVKSFDTDAQEMNSDFFALQEGWNFIEGYDIDVFVGSSTKTSSNVYKFSIHADVPFDIIKGGLVMRFRQDGDAYRYGGMTHKLKKVFNDRNIPASCRNLIPIICDGDGILWVPGLPVRDGVPGSKKSTVRILICMRECKKGERSVYTALARK